MVPCHLVFLSALHRLQSASSTSPNAAFLCAYLSCSLVQVFLLLYIAEILIGWMWSRGIDPDNSSIPYLTAFGDLFGTLFLFAAFLTLSTFQLATIS